MTVRVGSLAVVLAVFLALVPAGAIAAGGGISPSCSPGNCSGWYQSAVTVQFVITPLPGNSVTPGAECGPYTQSADTTGVTRNCVAVFTDSVGSTTSNASITVKKDSTPPVISGISARGPDANGWYNHPLAISVNATDATSGIASCSSTTYSGPDTAGGSFSGTCTDNAGNTANGGSFSFKYDATPPAVSVSLSRGPDANGWYNHPVDFNASGSDNLSGIASCTSGTIGGGGSAGASCTDNAGNAGGAGVPVNYDAGAPSIDSITFDRPPDSNGWYNHPVRVTFHGSDGGSGINSCTDVTYPGPDTTSTTISGTCTDNAGNRAGGTSPAFKYDATPPTISNLGFDWDDGTATLTWTASPDTKAIEIDRTPGTAGADPSAVFKGLASSFQDTGLTNKVKYVYTINAFDEAGNKATDSVSIVPGAKLYSPARGSVATSPPLLAWRPVTGASYYNLQVYYGVAKALRRVASLSVSGRKVMSVWPLQPRYRMRKTWTYKGKVRKLALGRYRWYVYPGVGKRTAHKYGPLIGQSDFVIAKR
jgi:hypothetical protein